MRKALARICGRIITFFARVVTAVQPVWQGIDPDETRQRVYLANYVSHGDFILVWAVLSPRARNARRALSPERITGKRGGCAASSAARCLMRC